jgi:2-keto-4-pentenoate hydratase
LTSKAESENRAAAILAGARLDRRLVEPLPHDLRPADLDAAYRVQDAVHARLAAGRYGARIGWKIACTTRVMQDYLGIPSPCAAGLFAGTRHASDVELPAAAFRRIGIECEIGVRFGQDLPVAAASDPDRIASCIDTVFAAIEIVDDRYVDWRRTDTPTLVADDFFAAGCVLGTEIPFGQVQDLAELAGATFVNGAEVGRGIGADVLGHPLKALSFLATSLAARGRQIGAGETVLTGSLVETRWLEAGDSATIEIGGLGTVGLLVTGEMEP